MPTTPINGLRFPALSDNANVPLYLSNLASDVDTRLIPRVANAAARDAALTTYAGLAAVVRLDTGTIEVRNAANTAWQTVAYFTDTGWTSFTLAAPLTNGVTGNQYRVVNSMCTVAIDINYSGTYAGGFVMATLPAEARPTRKLYFATTWFGDAPAYVSVDTTGALQVINGTAARTGMVGTLTYPVG